MKEREKEENLKLAFERNSFQINSFTVHPFPRKALSTRINHASKTDEPTLPPPRYPSSS